MENNIEFTKFTDLSNINPCQGGASFKKNDEKSEQPKTKKKDTLEKIKIDKSVGDMDDGRYIIYYEWS